MKTGVFVKELNPETQSMERVFEEEDARNAMKFGFVGVLMDD